MLVCYAIAVPDTFAWIVAVVVVSRWYCSFLCALLLFVLCFLNPEIMTKWPNTRLRSHAHGSRRSNSGSAMHDLKLISAAKSVAEVPPLCSTYCSVIAWRKPVAVLRLKLEKQQQQKQRCFLAALTWQRTHKTGGCWQKTKTRRILWMHSPESDSLPALTGCTIMNRCIGKYIPLHNSNTIYSFKIFIKPN